MSDSPLRFTFISARYGVDVLGGAEKHARHVAERLAARGHDVRVLTTRARAYATWASELPEGTTVENGVEVHRYASSPRRTPLDEALKLLSTLVPSSTAIARAWARAQGPVVRTMIDRLPAEARERDLIVFFQLLSYATFEGLPLVADRAALVPLVHEERPIYSALAGRTLTLPHTMLYNTEAESARIARVARGPLRAMIRAGVGLETPTPPSPTFTPPTRHPYVVVMGRQGKTRPLTAAWRALTTNARLPPLDLGGASVPWTDVRLVTVGEPSPMYDGLTNVVHAGYVSDRDRWDILRGAVALINPSLYESLSLVLLEAWTVGRPVVVHERCDVTTHHVRESGGGIAVDFTRPDEAAQAIATGIRRAAERQAMGRRGAAFADRTFSWERVLDIYEQVARATRSGHGAPALAGA